MLNTNVVSPRLPDVKNPMRGSVEFLPIRSVYYRKHKPAKLDPLQYETTGTTMPTISPQLSNGFPTIDIGSATTEESEKKTTILSSRPTTFRTTFHMLSSTARSPNKKQQQQSPSDGTTTQKLFFKSTTLKSSKPVGSDAQLTVRDFIIEMQKAQVPKNYFSDQVYEYYGSEQVINNPNRFSKYDQLSDPNKFMKKNIFQQNINIPTETEIKQTNRLRFSENIEEHENGNTLAIHFLGAATHNIKHLEDSFKMLIKDMGIFRHQKESFKQELKELGESDERTRRELVHNILSGVKRCEEILRESAVENHNEKIRMTKELVCLQKEKISLDKGIQEGLEKLQTTEIRLLGFEAFDLQTDDKNLELISSQNLRSEIQSSMTNRPIIH